MIRIGPDRLGKSDNISDFRSAHRCLHFATFQLFLYGIWDFQIAHILPIFGDFLNLDIFRFWRQVGNESKDSGQTLAPRPSYEFGKSEDILACHTSIRIVV